MWNAIACNSNYDDYLKEKESQRLYRSIQGIRPIVDTRAPKKIPHLKRRSKKVKLIEDRQEDINYKNQKLMDKMIGINSRNINKEFLQRVSNKSLNKEVRSKTNARINEENMKLLIRLQSAQPVLSAQRWEYSERNWQEIRSNIKKKIKKSRPGSSRESEGDLIMKILKRRNSRPTTALSSEYV